MPMCLFFGEVLRYSTLNPMLLATQGSIDGACLALDFGWAINLGGGFAHATKSSGDGAALFPDITLAAYYLKKWHSNRVKRVMIVDLDAHQGNGFARDFMGDEDIFILDCFNQ